MEQTPAEEKQLNSSRESPMNDADQPKAVDDSPAAQKLSLPVRIWNASGLNPMILIMMFKGAIAPTIALAMYQATSIATIYSTIGYLVPIMSIISMPILPRSKFIQNMVLNLFGICIGSCIALLEIYCSVQARLHTTPKVEFSMPEVKKIDVVFRIVDEECRLFELAHLKVPQSAGPGPTPGASVSHYNSSASAVSAIWLFTNIYFVNALRASRPQLQLAVIMYSIFAMIASTYSPSFPTMAAGIAFVKRLIEAFTLAFAIALGVNLFIFPVTCRKMFFAQSAGMIGILQAGLKAQKGYVQSLEEVDMFSGPESNIDSAKLDQEEKMDTADTQKGHHSHTFRKGEKPKSKAGESPQAAAMKSTISAMGELQGKMYADIIFAKRELAYGKLDAHAIETINDHFRQIMLPLYGMSSVTDIFSRVAEKRGWVRDGDPDTAKQELNQEEKIASVRQWNEMMKTLHEPFESMTGLMCEGLQHVSLALELTKPPKPSKATEKTTTEDVEASAGVTKPGDLGFRQQLKEKIEALYEKRQATLDIFLKQIGIDGHGRFAANSAEISKLEGEKLEDHKRTQRKLYMVLYMEFLMWSAGRAVLRFVEYADELVADGTMKKNRIINPGSKRLQKWISGLLNKEDMSSTEQTPDAAESGSAGVYSGASFQAKLDPEHLPPANAWERFTDNFRKIARFFASTESAFGFRVACATLSIGIVGFLANSQVFFQDQRLVWAMIMVAIGMTMTAGAGVFGFLGRIVGTFLAMCTSIIIWYIVDGHPAGVIVFFFVFTFAEFYIFIKYPKALVVTLLSIVTQVLIVGYELEVRKVGVKAATSNGQPAYRIYLLAPYRLACVAGGMFVAFVWTFFPYPLTERSQSRKDLGSALYLLANFYSVIHTSVAMRIKGTGGSSDDKESPNHKLDKARRDIWEKEMALIGSLRQHSAFSVWEPTFGGKFPKKTYDAIIEKVSSRNPLIDTHINSLVNYLSLIAYASRTFSSQDNSAFPKKTQPTTTTSTIPTPDQPPANDNTENWVSDFSRLVASINPTSQALTSTVALLAGAVAQGSPLPPYLKVPDPYMLSARLEALDGGILGVEHVLEPGYAAFAVMQIASSLVRDDLADLIEHVKLLVGEVDFTFHIHDSSSSTTAASSSDMLLEKDYQNGGEKGKRD